MEAIWNHILRYRGAAVERNGGQAAVTTSGDYNVIGFDEQLMIKYAEEGATPEKLTEDNILFMFKQKVTKPARLAGTALLVHETVDQVKEPRKAWTYNTGQRRVRLAPNIAYDTPGTAADGLRTTDDFDMFNGSPNRYNWKLVGKKEMFVAYNNYALHSDNVSYDEKDAVGRRYRRQDAAGTPYCITVDHQTKEDNTVTIRDRDTMEQERIAISELSEKLKKSISFKAWLQ